MKFCDICLASASKTTLLYDNVHCAYSRKRSRYWNGTVRGMITVSKYKNPKDSVIRYTEVFDEYFGRSWPWPKPDSGSFHIACYNDQLTICFDDYEYFDSIRQEWVDSVPLDLTKYHIPPTIGFKDGEIIALVETLYGVKLEVDDTYGYYIKKEMALPD